MSPVVIDPVIEGRTRSSADRVRLHSVHGRPLADVGMAPRLSAQRILTRLRSAANGVAPDADVFHAAGKLFATAELDGESTEDYVRNTVRSTGLTRGTIERSMADVVAGIEALPEVTRAELPETGLGTGKRTQWVPRGRVFTALMASNHPNPHVAWVQALFHGYSVAVRPGGRDPFTPRRLVAALLHAGLPAEKIAFVPSGHDVANLLVEQADRGIVYGGDAAVRNWRTYPVELRGPGRSKALVDVEADSRVLDHLVESAAFDGGTRCTNLSAVLTSGSVGELAAGLAERLAELPLLPADDPSATLLVMDAQRADGSRRQLDRLREELTEHSVGGGAAIVELDDGSFGLRPVVLSADRADHPAIGTELPFPFLVVAPWSEQDGVVPLRDSLVLNVLSERPGIVEEAVREPSVRKVTEGRVLPWESTPGIPHDGNFTQFLLEPKGILRG